MGVPLQVRLSGCSFMRWGQPQENVWLKLIRHRWVQGLFPSTGAHGLGAERDTERQRERERERERDRACERERARERERERERGREEE